MIGTVAELHRWPVKSMGGEPVAALALDGRGALGDRAHAVWREHKRRWVPLTAREAPRLLAWHAASDGDPDGRPRITAPDGTLRDWHDPALLEALEADLGRTGLQLRDHPTGEQDLHESVLVTTQASLDALQGELPDLAPDLRRFRTNLHLVLDVPAYAEHGWEGRTLRVGEAELALLHPCVRCAIPTRDPDTQAKAPELLRHLMAVRDGLFGINARPTGPATVRVGDPVELV